MNSVHTLRGLDLNLLVSLQTLASTTSVTEAAKRMAVTQSAMSHQLRRLRDLFDDPLFVTTARPMRPTPRTRQLLPLLGEILASVEALTAQQAPFTAATCKRRFTVACSDLAEVFYAPSVNELVREAPAVSVQFVRRGPRVTEGLERGEVDVAILPADVPGIPPLRGMVRRRRLGSDGFSVLMRQEHPNAGLRLTLARYLAAEHILVSPSGGSKGLVDGVLAKRGKSRRVALQVAHFLSAAFVVSQSDFIATVPTRCADGVAKSMNLDVRPLPFDTPKVDAHAYWHETAHNDPAARWFRRSLFGVADRGEN